MREIHSTIPEYRKSINMLCVLTAAALLQGCGAKLKVQPVTAPKLAPGIDYALSRAKVDVGVTWTLKSCGDDLAVFEPRIVLEHNFVADETQKFRIDYLKFAGPLANTELDVALYENGTLKSLNAAAEDRTAPVAISTLSAIGKVAATSMGIAVASTATPRPTWSCTEDAVKKLAAKEAKEEAIRKLEYEMLTVSDLEANLKKRELDRERERLVALVAAISISRKLEDVIPALAPPAKDSDSSSRGKSTAQQSTTSESAKDADASSREESRRELDESIRNMKVNLEIPQTDETYKALVTLPKATKAVAPSNSFARLLLVTENVGDTKPTDFGKGRCREKSSIHYRSPRNVTLVVRQVDPSGSTVASGPKVFLRKPLAIPQGASLQYLPFCVGAFGNRTLKAVFTPGGALESLRWTTKAPAEQAATVLPGAADAAGKFVPAAKAANADLTAERDRLKLIEEIQKSCANLAGTRWACP